MPGVRGRLAGRAARALGLVPRRGPAAAAFDRALRWLAAHSVSGAGVQVSSRQPRPYPEVTGYLIPTLLAWGERDRARQYARWLISIQRPDGSWRDPDGGCSCPFDSGQILKGLLAILPEMPEAREPARRGCDWLAARIDGSGRVAVPDTRHLVMPDGGMVPEDINLYALAPLKLAAAEFGDGAYAAAADRALGYYLAKPALTAFTALSHFHAYVLEALLDLGRPERAAEGMAEVEKSLRPDGAVPARPGARWVCSTGLAQYALVWYRLGRRAPAERAFAALLRMQSRSGGFRGSRGPGADYFAREEIGWAIKFFLDALAWRIRTSFEADAADFPATVGSDDGRLRLVAEAVAEARPRAVLDAGCGKGRFIRRIKELEPGIRAIGLDVSEAMLAELPAGVERLRGSLLSVPLPDGAVDLAFSVEALEHAVNVPAALRELGRVVGRPGTLVIIDKNAGRRGSLAIGDWERWFSPEEISRPLEAQGFTVQVYRGLPYDGSDGRDGLFLGWVARR